MDVVISGLAVALAASCMIALYIASAKDRLKRAKDKRREVNAESTPKTNA